MGDKDFKGVYIDIRILIKVQIYILDLEDSSYEERFIKNKYSPIFIKMNIDEVVNMNPEDLKLIVVNNYIDVVIPEKKVDDYNRFNIRRKTIC